MLFLTLTLRHGREDGLAETVRGLNAALRRMRQRRGFRGYMRRMGAIGDVRIVEVTHGAHGWHPHVHAALFCIGEPPEELRHELEEWIALEWRQAVIAELGWDHAPSLDHGADLRVWDSGKLEQYLSKLGFEIVDPGSKAGRRGSRTPFQIAEAAVGGDAHALELWREYVEAMVGRRFMEWSRGSRDVRALYGLRERTDEEIVEGEAQGELVGLVSAAEWDRGLREQALALLEAAERAHALDVRRVGEELWRVSQALAAA